jgi:hypothetical protein
MMEVLVRETLARHREDPPPGMNLMLPIHHQMDQDFCGAVSNDLMRYCTAWEKRLATSDLWRQLPAQCGVYMFVFASTLVFRSESNSFSPTWVIYVGRAGSATSNRTVRDRYYGEYCKYIGKNPEVLWHKTAPSTREERMARFLTIYPLQYWYTTIEDHEKIPSIEDRLIKLLSPVLNDRQLPRLRPQPPQAAFRSIP